MSLLPLAFLIRNYCDVVVTPAFHIRIESYSSNIVGRITEGEITNSAYDQHKSENLLKCLNYTCLAKYM